MSLHIRYILLVVLVCVCNASLAVGASVTITSSGGGVFTVQGDNMKGMSGINLTIGYEKSLLSSPVVKWGTLALEADMHIANTTTTPGSIMVAIIKAEPFAQNNGPIATVTFSAQNSSCGITTVDAKVLNNAHKYVPVQVSVAAEAVCEKAADPKAIDPVLISTPGIPFSQPEAVVVPPATTVVTTTTTTAAVAAPAQLQKALGTVIMPGDIQPRKDDKPVESRAVVSSEPVEVVETATRQFKQSLPEKAAEEIEPAAINQTVYGSVLNRFRVYQGERTPEIMLALFTKDVSSSITQIPAVVVSDGKASVRVFVDQSAIKGTSTNFALNGAKLVSLKKEDDSGRWVLEIMPNLNSLTATVTILNSSSMIDYPLTVVPPVAVVTTKKADFEAFLKDRGAPVPKYDLNGDGRHDYLDDFIYTAHYLRLSNAAAR